MLSSNEDLDNREKIKPSEHRFADNGEQMFEVATRCKAKWIDAFFLYSMIWAFGSILTENAKREFSNWLKKILKEKDDERIALERRARYKDSDAGSQSGISEEITSESGSSRTSKSKASVIEILQYQPTVEFAMGNIN